jgi:hypothetical protein
MFCALLAVSRAVVRCMAKDDCSYLPAEQRRSAVAEVAEQAIAPLVLGIMSRRGGGG